TLRYGEHFLLPDSVSTVVENLTDTLFSVENLKAGKTYYWRVTAHTGDLKTDAFNTKNVIYSREGTTLSGTVSNILKLTREDSPYLIEETLVVAKGARLIAEPGVTILMKQDAGMLIEGALE